MCTNIYARIEGFCCYCCLFLQCEIVRQEVFVICFTDLINYDRTHINLASVLLSMPLKLLVICYTTPHYYLSPCSKYNGHFCGFHLLGHPAEWERWLPPASESTVLTSFVMPQFLLIFLSHWCPFSLLCCPLLYWPINDGVLRLHPVLFSLFYLCNVNL